MEGLPAGLAVVTFSAPAGEVVVMLDKDANRLAEPLDAFRVRSLCASHSHEAWAEAWLSLFQ